MELSLNEGDYQDRRSRAFPFTDVAHQERADHVSALRFDVFKERRSRLRVFDADVQRFGPKRISLLGSLLPDAGPLRGFHLARRYLHQARHRHWRRFSHARELTLILQQRLLHREGSNLRTKEGRSEEHTSELQSRFGI